MACSLLVILITGLHEAHGNMRNTIERLGPVTTPEGQTNELIYAPPCQSIGKTPSPVLVFFGGDVQDYPEVMTAHRDHGHYVKWSLTNIASLMAEKFPSHHVFIVKPSRMERKTFSCYDNFVESNSVGAPTHNPGVMAIKHLDGLITEGLKKVASIKAEKLLSSHHHYQETCSGKLESCEVNVNPQSTDETAVKPASGSEKPLPVDKAEKACDSETKTDVLEYEEITLIGFSKGCVVLNQLIIEFHLLSVVEDMAADSLRKFMSKVRNMYWLDGGHAGGSKTWITDHAVLKDIASQPNLGIHIHVSPYQVQDDQRPWIRKECKVFYNVLRRNGANISYTLHCEHEQPSLLSHFKVLDLFS
ncbi:mitochondrial protein C2orf69 homolog isoform X2 [Penaeus indicus]|uniref:mitochondrial protein C2orf69 homolog isoform X2 n=1 Tax=Penaeus indicus TaxID=29960 RepID=UPI00300D441C